MLHRLGITRPIVSLILGPNHARNLSLEWALSKVFDIELITY